MIKGWFFEYDFFNISLVITLFMLASILGWQFYLRILFNKALKKTTEGIALDQNLKDLELAILSFDENDPLAKLDFRHYHTVSSMLRNLIKNMNKSIDFLKDERKIQLVKSCFWYIKTSRS
jgi:hypothetical protein